MTSLFGHAVRSDLALLYVTEALAVFVALYVLLLWSSLAPEQRLVLALVGAMLCGIISGATGLYRAETMARARRLLRATVVAGLLFTLSLPALAMVDSAVSEGLENHLAGIALAFGGAVVTTRLGYAAISRSGLLKRRLVVLREPGGGVLDIERLNAEVRHGGYELAGTLSPADALTGALDPARLRAMRIWAVVADARMRLTPELRDRCEEAGARLLSDAELIELEMSRLDIEALPAGWLRSARALRESAVEVALRRGFDIVFSAAMIAFSFPLLLLTALAIKLDSRGSVLYRQERVGQGNRPFMVYKFRSMRVDAEQAGSPVWASTNDPRVTRVGRFIWLTRIDEFPQFFNVLRGEMSIVGPRPERPGFVEHLARQIPHYHDRACIKPGITGWAQVNYPYGASVEDARMKLAYDLYYVQRRSLFLDLLILVATIRVILFQEGAR